MEMTALRRPDPKYKGCYQWLIANGPHMGRWTNLFGVNCLADLGDNKQYVEWMLEETPNGEIEHYTLTKDDK